MSWSKGAAAYGLVAVVLWAGVVYWGNDALELAAQDQGPSVARGTTSKGSLEKGVRLPSAGPNYRSYSRFGSLIGRTSVHSRVKSLLLASYARLHQTHPDLRFKIGETGWPSGGRFRPHRTHQNGLSLDLMVPVRRGGEVDWLPTWPWHLFGYGIDFDSEGRWRELTIDFDAMALHLQTLRSLSSQHGLEISRVIVAPDLQPELLAASSKSLRSLPFNTGQAWVRHDEHYHLDFVVIP